MKIEPALVHRPEHGPPGEGVFALRQQRAGERAVYLPYFAGPDERLIDRARVGDGAEVEAVVDECVGGRDEQPACDEEQPGAGQSDPGPHAAPSEGLAPALPCRHIFWHTYGIRYPPPITVSTSGGARACAASAAR